MARVGRPREFDRDEALRKALELFWSQGYEGTTLTDLQKAMGGITAPSFYAAFGSKEDLFRETVQLYNRVEGAPLLKALMEGRTARSSIGSLLHAAVESFSNPSNPKGCFMVLGAINCGRSNRHVEDFMQEQRALREKVIKQRLRRAISEGDLPKSADIGVLASFYSALLDGLALHARDGAPRKTLLGIVERAMDAWEVVATTIR